MRVKSLRAGWANVDEADDPSRFVALMDRVRGVKDVPSQYSIVKDLLNLGSGQRVLDVGCGTGAAVRVFADVVGGTGKVIGLDSSMTMIREAKRRSRKHNQPVEFRLGDAHNLPFPDNYFDCVFSLRVFEIIENPVKALKEIFRVTRPEGQIYVNGPDVDVWTFDVPNRDVTRKILHYVCDNEVNGWIGRQLPRMFAELGGLGVNVLLHTEFLTDFDLMYDLYLREFVERAEIARAISTRAAKSWTEDLRRRCAAGPFACTQRMFRVVGTKP